MLLALFLLFATTVPALAQVPSKVTLSRANSPTADGFTVAWSDLSNETAYHLEHTTSANFTSSTLITNISANATSHALTGLTPGTTYYVRVRGTAAGGNGTWSDVQANQLLSIDPGQTRYLSVAGVPYGASHSVNFTISDIFGSANAAGLASAATSSEASTILLLGSNGSTAHTVFYNSSQNQWREGDTNKGSEIVGFGKGFMVKNNASSADIFLLSGAVPPLESGAVTVFAADAPAGRLSLVTPSRTMATSLRSLGLTFGNNTTTGLKRATTAKDADLLLIPDSAGGLRRYHFDGTNWRSGLRTVSDPASVTVPAGGAFFLRKASGSSFQQWRPPPDIVKDGLVLHLDAGNTASYPGNGTNWTDLSGNGYNGTLINGPTFNSGNGGTIVFDSTDDRATIPYNSNLNLCNINNWTISVWIMLTDLLGDFNCIIAQWPQGGGDAWLLSHSKGTVGFAWAPFTTATNMFQSNTPLTVNNWTNVVLVKNGSAFTLYQNTSVVGNFTNSATKNSTNQIELGRYGGRTEWIGAHYSIASIYHIPLSHAQIIQNYNATKRRFEDPDAKAYLDAVEAADGQALEPDVREAVDKFVKGCKADGIWSAIKASCILAGARTLNGALVPLVGTAPTNVGGNFASGDYNRESGLKGNAGNKLLNSNRDNSADPQNNQHLAVFATAAGTTNARFAGYGNGTTGRTTLGHNTSTQLTTRSRSNAFITHSTAYSVPCLVGVSRSSSSEYIFIRNGTTGAVASTSETPAAGSIEIFRGSVDPSNSRLAFYSIGESLNLTLLQNRVSTLVTDLAAAIP